MNRPQLIALIIGAVSFLLSCELVHIQITAPPFCPPLFGLPACYLVLALYGVVSAVTPLPISIHTNRIYFAATGTGLAIAIWFSFRQLTGLGHCPQLFGVPVPLCYASLISFGLLAYLRLWAIKTRQTK
ncbi:MAG: hypothetical protein JXX14_21235 [Deltaproteobacteria bacterium]|nr:hypothetical protein [Deltaproteobacteria bacterium]